MSSNMKVRRTSASQPSRIAGTSKSQETAAIGRVSFREILDDANDDERRRQLLQALLDDVDTKGRELVENRTVESLFAYKELVKVP